MPLLISSTHNERIKELARLEKRAERDRRRQTVVEGAREVVRALRAGVIPDEAFLCRERLRGDETLEAVARLEELDRARRTRLFEVTPELFARLAVREESGGLLIVIPYLERTLESLSLRTPPFLAVVEGVEKPGNLGAILRSADAAGVDGLIVSAGATDLHNPNVVRASLGTLFSVPICETPTAETIAWLKTRSIAVVATRPDAQTLYTAVDYRRPVAIVMGSEAHGLSDLWSAAADALVTIPMRGIADSLNLATATALMLYEVVRQRGALSSDQ